MAGQHLSDAIRLAGKAIRGTLNFRGRSTRSEVLAFWLAVMFAGVPLTLLLVLIAAVEAESKQFAATILGYVAFIPLAALFARRLHDIDRSGWWALAGVPVLLVNGYQSARASLDAAPPSLPWWGSLAMLIPIGIVFTFLIAPGTEGPNRFGPDPRRSIHPEQLRARDQQDEAEGAQDPLLR